MFGLEGMAPKVRVANPRKDTAMMHEHEKSDDCVVPMKRSNKRSAKADSAEGVEERRSTKGNSLAETKNRTQSRDLLRNACQRVREAANRYRNEPLTSLWHHCYNIDHLRAVFYNLKKNASPGVDGVMWETYEEDLETNLADLSSRLARGAYQAKPVRRTFIPKADGSMRPLGIPVLEDKLVQSLTKSVLEEVYELMFAGFSYGSRPGRKAHDALDALTVAIEHGKVNWVLDADLRGYFDAIDHDRLMEMIEHRIGDKRVLRHIKKWLNAGVLEEGQKTVSEYGTPQGGSISSLLANIYLHYVLDEWVENWRRTQATGSVRIVRYVDDFVLGFSEERDARRFLAGLKQRLAEFHLELHPEKTRLIQFGKFAAERRERRGLGRPETFDFLGFTHMCVETRRGKFRIGRKTIKKRLRAKLLELKEELRKRMHHSIRDVGTWLGHVLAGYFRFHAVPGNIRSLSYFRDRLTRLWYTVIRRRSHKARLRWSRMHRIVERYLPQPKILHPWPDKRFYAKHPR